ncbi:class I SAM-dependent methyltransferase [Bacteroidia bacterium]|jgi:O-methyltransferase|nr:class I SAM-dependent methyltransferase [Bacteroidia bacterium]
MISIQLIRWAKRTLLRLGIHKILPARKLTKLGYTAYLSEWIRHNRPPYTSFPYSGFDTRLRYNLYDHLIAAEKLNDAIDYLEFGVAAGNSFVYWEQKITNKAASFHGFDTFTGLPEDWGHFKKGAMSSNNEMPAIDGNRHHWHQGLFQVTLPRFLENYAGACRKVIHLDADLFSSTLYVLTSLSPYLKSGDILMFDKFNVPLDEFKAFKIWVDSYYIEYEVLGEVNNYYQTAIKIK